MPEYHSGITIDAPAQEVYRFICDPSNMPMYLPTVEAAEKQGERRVKVSGNAAGHKYESDGWLTCNDAEMKMEWGSDGENVYHGRMTVEGDEASCHIQCVIDFEPRAEQKEAFRSQTGNEHQTVQTGIDQALQAVKNICEGVGGPLPAGARARDRGYLG